MKKFFLFLTIAISLASCQKDSVAKPENLIPKETMVDIIYDLSVLQSLRNSNQTILDTNKINPSTYIYKKYKIDSLQFAKSNQYYAAENIKNYEKLYQNVNDRLLQNKALADTLAKKEEIELKNKLKNKSKNADSTKRKKMQSISAVQ